MIKVRLKITALYQFKDQNMSITLTEKYELVVPTFLQGYSNGSY